MLAVWLVKKPKIKNANGPTDPNSQSMQEREKT